MEDMCREAARLGLKGIDLVGPDDWPVLKKYGLLSTMRPRPATRLGNGHQHKENHAKPRPECASHRQGGRLRRPQRHRALAATSAASPTSKGSTTASPS